MSSFASYKGRIFGCSFVFKPRPVHLRSNVLLDDSFGFEHLKSEFFDRIEYGKFVKYDELDMLYKITIRAVYKGCVLFANFDINKDFNIHIQTKEKQYFKDLGINPFNEGFHYWDDHWSKYVDFNECSEIYEKRKDLILPKGFIPGETKELSGGYTVTDYNLEKEPFVTSRKTIYKDGIKLADFVEDL